MHCNNCGSQLNNNARFCNQCGHPIQKNNSQSFKKAIDIAKNTFQKVDTFLQDQGVIDTPLIKPQPQKQVVKPQEIPTVHPPLGFALSFAISILVLIGFIVHFLIRLAKTNIDVFMPVIVLISLFLLLCFMMFFMSFNQEDAIKIRNRYSKFNGWIKKNNDYATLIIFGIYLVDFFLGIIILIQALT